jgi:leucyl-tRNA synthetase
VELIESAKTEEKVRPFLEGKHVVKAIAVPDKLVNFVVK